MKLKKLVSGVLVFTILSLPIFLLNKKTTLLAFEKEDDSNVKHTDSIFVYVNKYILNQIYTTFVPNTVYAATDVPKRGMIANVFCSIKELFGGSCDTKEEPQKDTESAPIKKEETSNNVYIKKDEDEKGNDEPKPTPTTSSNTKPEVKVVYQTATTSDGISRSELNSILASFKQELLSIIPRETTIIERESRARNFIVNTDRALTEGTTDFSGSTITTTGNGTIGGSLNVTGNVTANAFIGDGSGLTGIESLPTQTGNSGKYLTTDGTTASWATVASFSVSDLNNIQTIQVGNSNNASGLNSSAFGVGNTASGQRSSASGYYNTASGVYSSASGYYNTASEEYSSAFGSKNIASGANSSASGYYNTASGPRSSAFGYSNSASGDFSSASGYQNTSSLYFSSAFGSKNIASGNFSSAFGYQNTASGANSSASGYYNTASGNHSSSSGYKSVASGISSSAIGYKNTASGDFSSALGIGNCSSAFKSYSIGGYNTASGCFSSASGYRNSASTCSSSAFGYCNTSSGQYSSSFGYCNCAVSGYFTSALGYKNIASGNFSSAFGYQNTASGNSSYAFGANLLNNTDNSLEIGPSNTAKIQLTSTYLRPVTSNSQTLGGASNLWTAVYATNGTIQTSDERLKENIEDLDYGLDEVLALRPVSYDWKDGSNNQRKLGLIAQEVLDTMPEVVYGDDDSYLGINYADLVPSLISAIQELAHNISESITTKFIKTEKIETKEICIDDICITKDDFVKVVGEKQSSENTNNGQVVEVGDSYTENENGEIEEIDPTTGENLDTEEETEVSNEDATADENTEVIEETQEEVVEEVEEESELEEVVEENITDDIEVVEEEIVEEVLTE